MNLNTRQRIYTDNSYHSEDDYDAKQDWNRGRTTRRRNSIENRSIKRGQRLLHSQCLLHDLQLWKSLKHFEYEYEECDCTKGTVEERSGIVTSSFTKEKHDVNSLDTNQSNHSYDGGHTDIDSTDEEIQHVFSDGDDNDGDDSSYDTISIDGKDQEQTTIFKSKSKTVLPYDLQIDLHKTTNKSNYEGGTIWQKKYLKKKVFGTLLVAFLISSYFNMDVAWFPFFTMMR